MIAGFEIGHHTADEQGWLTGTTVVLAREGAVGGVDVRGGGPGTRETDLLEPGTLVEEVHAVVLTGGSAYGLAAADGVMQGLEEQGIGFSVGPGPHEVVPIVPGAVIFDLGRGGDFAHRPSADFGVLALAAATTDPPVTGCVGAGTGAVCGGLKGGFGYAEQQTSAGVGVAAAVVVNAAGSAVDPETGRLWADQDRRLTAPSTEQRAVLAAASRGRRPSFATTIGVVLTDLTLSGAHARKVAAVAHDGMARALRPVHSMTDGDTVFCLASGHRAADPDPAGALGTFNEVLTAAAEVFAAACQDALLAATTRGPWLAYRDLVPSAAEVRR